MKKLKKLLSIVLAVAMVMSLAVSVGATSQTYTITITNTKSGHTYEAYQIFTGTLSDNETVLSNIAWGSGVSSDDLIVALKSASDDSGSALYECFPSVDSGGQSITYTATMIAEIVGTFDDNSDEAKAFAQIVSKNLSSTAAGTSVQTESPYTITGLKAGYYLVKDKDGTVTADGDAYTDIILEVVKNVSTSDKSDYPSVVKEVSDEDASIGDIVTYTITGSVPDTSAYSTYAFTFNDTLSAGLTYETGTLKVYVETGFDSAETLYKLVDGVFVQSEDAADTGVKYYSLLSSGYTQTIGSYDETTGTEITVAFTDVKSYSEKDIVVVYGAKLNSSAVIGNDGNTNTVYVTYSNNPNASGTGNTPRSVVVTFTFELDITKVDSADNTKALDEVKFQLYKEVGGDTYYAIVDETTDKVTGWTTDSTAASTLTTANGGKISVIGLDTGTYYLKETATIDAYNLLENPVAIAIAAEYSDVDNDGIDEVSKLTVSVDGADATKSTDEESVTVKVENSTGSNLPETGGIGVTIFYVVGGILVLAAAGVIVISKKRRTEK